MQPPSLKVIAQAMRRWLRSSPREATRTRQAGQVLPIFAIMSVVLLGGAALQQCLAQRWVGYDFSVFRRDES